MDKKTRMQKAKKDLENACMLFGWEERDNFDSALHAKNFLKAYMKVEQLDKNKAYNNNFQEVIDMIENNPILKAYEKACYSRFPTKEVLDSINRYIQLMQEGRLKGIEGYDTIRYAKDIRTKIKPFIPAF